MKIKQIFFILTLLLCFSLGLILEKKTNFLSFLKASTSESIPWDSLDSHKWNPELKVVEIASSADHSTQHAYFLAAKKKSPLIVSLHTWSGSYQQEDPISDKVLGVGWNYIHPDFRGANNNANSCLSDLVISDINDSIAYAIDNGNVDLDNIFVIGVSGGGYTNLGYFLKAKYKINTFFSWVPISDLSKWYEQSKSRNTKYSVDILGCTNSEKDLNINEAKKRSPLYWEIPSNGMQKIEIYAGIKDGYTGSVPTSHSIDFYNKIAIHDGGDIVTADETVDILSRSIFESEQLIGGRKVLYKKKSEHASIIIFDGGHEMITDYAFDRINELIE